jgi:hypothetical protein
MWILVLTLVAPSTSGGSTIAQVLGFTSEQTCVAAGNFWLQNLPATFSNASAVCLKT